MLTLVLAGFLVGLAAPSPAACGVGLIRGRLPSVWLGQVSPRVPELDQAQAQLDAGDFEDAIQSLEKGLAAPDLSDDQLVELYKMLGLAHLYLGNEEKARQAFEKLLQARPDYDVPKSSSSKVKALYGRIKEDIKKRRVRPVTLSLEPLREVKGGAPLELSAHIENLALGAKAKLFYRRSGAQAFSSADFTRARGTTDKFVVTVPAFEVPSEERGYDIEYYVEVADAAQRRLAGKGDAYNPLVFHVTGKGVEAPAAEPERPWYAIPWVWVGVGVGVAAIATTAAVLATQKQGATVQIMVTVNQQ